MPYFFVWIFRPEMGIYLQGRRFFDKFENIIHELNFNFENLSRKLFRFRHFTDFDIKIVLLG